MTRATNHVALLLLTAYHTSGTIACRHGQCTPWHSGVPYYEVHCMSIIQLAHVTSHHACCRRAKAIEGSYCEPDYWIGMCLINQGKVYAGMEQLKVALGCKYVAAESLKALNRLYVMAHQTSPVNLTPLLVSDQGGAERGIGRCKRGVKAGWRGGGHGESISKLC